MLTDIHTRAELRFRASDAGNGITRITWSTVIINHDSKVKVNGGKRIRAFPRFLDSRRRYRLLLEELDPIYARYPAD